MRRILAGICLVALTLAIAVAPARAGDKPIEINYWGLFTGGDGDFMKDMVAEFNESQSEIRVKYMSLIYDEYYMKLRTASVTGRGPDMAVSHVTSLGSLNNDGILAPFDDAVKAAGVDLSKYNRKVMEECTIDGKVMAIPLDTHFFVFYYNTDILGKAGVLDADNKPIIGPGPEGFMDFLRTIKKSVPSDTGVFVTFMDTTTSYRVFMTLFYQLGGELLTPDGKKAAFNQDGKAKQAMEYLVKMVDEDLWPKGSQMSAEVFKSGKAAIHAMGVWATGEFERTPGLNFAVVPFPRVFNTAATYGDSHAFVLIKQRKPNPEKEAAIAKFADWMSERGAYWAKAGHVPIKGSVVLSPEFKDLPYRSDYASAVDDVVMLPQNKHIDAINSIMSTNVCAVFLGQMGVDEALAKMEDAVNK